jgi:hypothetical protein
MTLAISSLLYSDLRLKLLRRKFGALQNCLCSLLFRVGAFPGRTLYFVWDSFELLCHLGLSSVIRCLLVTGAICIELVDINLELICSW